MKPVRFLGDSLKRLREFPEDVRQHAVEPRVRRLSGAH